MHETEGPALNMAKRDYYETLGLARGASEQELKSAYRRLAKELHPDRNPGDTHAEVRFKELNEAYEVLKDPQKRAAYDHFGHAAFEHGGGGAAASAPTSPRRCRTSSTTCSASSWAAAAAAAPDRAPPASAAPTCATISRSRLSDAYVGKTAQIRVPTSVSCETCSGSGARAGTKPTTCPTCAGHGKVRASQGFFTIERTCPSCQGRGETIEDPCPAATARAASPRSARSPSIFRPASRTARASGSPAKARPACAAARRATSTFSCRSSRTRSSSATAPTSSARCRSP